MDTDPLSPKPTTASHLRADSPAAESPRIVAKISSNREIAVVQADYLALANDLEQAQALASALEMELSGKTNELARFKLIWERAQGDLVKFEHDIDALRKERHALANEAQHARAYENKFQRAQTANDELTARAERLESELLREREAHMRTRAKLDALLDRTEPATAADGPLRRTLEDLRAQIDRALSRAPAGTALAPEAAKSERIEIEFSA